MDANALGMAAAWSTSVAVALAVVLGSYLFPLWYSQWQLRGASQRHRQAAAARRRQAAALCAENPAATRLTGVDFANPAALQALLAAGTVTVHELVKEALRQCLAPEHLNAVCEVVPDWEKVAHSVGSASKATQGLLYGMPVSLKECLTYPGLSATIGDAKRLTPPSSGMASVVKALLRQGAVPVVTTNLPQTMLTFECSNPIYGETDNPVAHGRTCGGSSGGEAVLHRLRAVPFGIGTDIGGSIRIPAHCCGTVGFKPSRGRVSSRGIVSSLPGQAAVAATAGPMAATVAGCVLCFRALCAEVNFMREEDATIVPLPFNEVPFSDRRRLTVGVLCDNNFFDVTPACKRAVTVAAAALEARGHKVVQFTGVDVLRLSRLYYALMTADGGSHILELLRGQDIDSRIAPLVNLVKLPQLVHTLAAFLPASRYTTIVAATGKKTVAELWKLQAELSDATAEFAGLWGTQGLDALLTPASCMPAPKQGHCSDLTPGCWPTFLFNLLDLPAGVVPATHVTVREWKDPCLATAIFLRNTGRPVTQAEDDEKLLSRRIRDPFDHKVIAACRGSIGTPVGVQVVTARFQDELCLRLMGEVEADLAPHVRAHRQE